MFVSGSCKHGSHKNVSATPFEEIIITSEWGRPSRGPPTRVNVAAIHLPAKYIIKKNIHTFESEVGKEVKAGQIDLDVIDVVDSAVV